MNTLKLVWMTFVQLVRQACQLPQEIVKAVKHRQRQTVLDKREAERLDRICNPLKYRGK
jgi:hypothetical protein